MVGSLGSSCTRDFCHTLHCKDTVPKIRNKYSQERSCVATVPIPHSWEYINHRHMNVEIGTEAPQFPEKEYINGIFVAVWLLFYIYSWLSTKYFFPHPTLFHLILSPLPNKLGRQSCRVAYLLICVSGLGISQK